MVETVADVEPTRLPCRCRRSGAGGPWPERSAHGAANAVDDRFDATPKPGEAPGPALTSAAKEAESPLVFGLLKEVAEMLGGDKGSKFVHESSVVSRWMETQGGSAGVIVAQAGP
jgi:hypothetical protein